VTVGPDEASALPTPSSTEHIARAMVEVTDLGVLVCSIVKSRHGAGHHAPPWILLGDPAPEELGTAVVRALAASDLALEARPDRGQLQLSKQQALGWGPNGPRELSLLGVDEHEGGYCLHGYRPEGRRSFLPSEESDIVLAKPQLPGQLGATVRAFLAQLPSRSRLREGTLAPLAPSRYRGT
jgi:hypothetical protein